MYMELVFTYNDEVYAFDLLNKEDFTDIFIPGVLKLKVWHTTDANYYCEGFFYPSGELLTRTYVKGKNNLFNFISKVIARELSNRKPECKEFCL